MGMVNKQFVSSGTMHLPIAVIPFCKSLMMSLLLFNGTESATSIAFGTAANAAETVSLNTEQISGKSRDETLSDRTSLNREIYKTDLTNLSIVLVVISSLDPLAPQQSLM